MTKHIVLEELPSGRTHVIDLPCMIGRRDGADLAVSDPAVSHEHALIEEINEQLWIQDLNSVNGVVVNGGKIKDRAMLHWGNRIQLGQTEFLVSREKENVSEQTIVLHAVGSESDWRPDQKRLKLLYGITTELAENQDLETLGKKIFLRLQEIFEQDRGYLAAFQEDGALKPLFSHSFSGTAPISRSIVNRLFENAESFLLQDALGDVGFKEQESIIGLRIRSALCAPLIYHGQIYGMVYLDRNVPGAYRQEDLELLKAIAFMLAPLIENARLWSQLNRQYAKAVETLKKTESRLIETERTAAYVHLAQAMAHEIRNPLMAIGGLVKRMDKASPAGSSNSKLKTVMALVERMETVLKEVDRFVTLPKPRKQMERMDRLIQEIVENYDWGSAGRSHGPSLFVRTSRLAIPVDAELFTKALHMIFKEILLSPSQEKGLEISVEDYGDALQIRMGSIEKNGLMRELFDGELQDKPWSLGLFLNIAHKIISDHGGTLLLDSTGNSVLPVIIRIPRIDRKNVF